MNRRELLEHVHRSFACWAARRAWRIVECRPCESVVLAVERYLRGETDFAEVCVAREADRGGAAGAGMIGVPRGIPAAAAQIAAWHTADDCAGMAARRVIHHAALAAGLHALGEAADTVALIPSEAASSGRNYHIWRRAPQIELAADSIERAILEGELQRWLDRAGGESENGNA